ncbi:MAG: hypothetical protein ABSE89_06695 [Sedimentisphaerales bacterium]
MTKKLMMVAGLCAVVCLLLSSTAFGKVKSPKSKSAATAETKVKGKVSVIENANNVVTSVKLTTANSTYNVVLDTVGLKIGNTMADKKIKATGVVSQKGDQKWIEIKKFKAVKKTLKHKKHKKA